LRLTVRADGARDQEGSEAIPRTVATLQPASQLVERLFERVRVIDRGGVRGHFEPVLRRLATAVAGQGERTSRPGRLDVAVASAAAPIRTASGPAGGMVRAPASVSRVLAVPRPVPASAAPAALSPPDTDRSQAALTRVASPGPVKPAPSLAELPPAVVEHLTDRVVRAIDRRIVAARERFGLGPG
jgi:hypothetical protein